jgi:hypothetical protein
MITRVAIDKQNFLSLRMRKAQPATTICGVEDRFDLMLANFPVAVGMQQG